MDGIKAAQPEVTATDLALLKTVAAKVGRKLPPCVELDDLIQWGYFGLVDAKIKYNPDKSSFKTYAALRIRGAILDGIRDFDIVPRRIRRRGEAPGFISLSGVVAEGNSRDVTIGDNLYDAGSFAPVERIDNNDLFESLIVCLRGRMRQIVRMYYWENLTMNEIGEELGIHQSRVSQLHGEALQIIKANQTLLPGVAPPASYDGPQLSNTDIIITPAKRGRAPIKIECSKFPGESLTIKEAIDRTGISKAAIYSGIRRGRSVGKERVFFSKVGGNRAPVKTIVESKEPVAQAPAKTNGDIYERLRQDALAALHRIAELEEESRLLKHRVAYIKTLIGDKAV